MFSVSATLSPQFEERLLKVLAGQFAPPGFVRQLSDFYIAQPGQPTPWNDPSTRAAYLSYFLPLNVARLRAVWREVQRFLPPEAIHEIWDFGSGLGATQWVLEDEDWIPPRAIHCLELSNIAIQTHESLIAVAPTRWQPRFSKDPPRRQRVGALAVFSYSFLEMKGRLPDLGGFDHLLIVEPSTRDSGRELLAWRQRWLDQGFSALAPCTHDRICPLLAHSDRDWCHRRVAFAAPDWWLGLEECLPMKNRTLTYSYLLMSRTAKDLNWRDATRVIGDTRHERGKARQMICRGVGREFLSWLTREGAPPFIPNGALIRELGTVEQKNSELRVARDLAWEV
jgi:hypothetical protein